MGATYDGRDEDHDQPSNPIPSTFPTKTAAWVVNRLMDREAYWRERLGDDSYERAVAHWSRAAGYPARRTDEHQ